MNARKHSWIGILFLVGAAIALPLLFMTPGEKPKADDPWEKIPPHLPQTNHAALLPGPFEDGPAVTRACLECHEDAAFEVMSTPHWTWESEPVAVEGHQGRYKLGKKNLINNFCISVQSNWVGCTSCHAGYGWKDENFDFSKPDLVDCLVCHDHSGTYAKSKGGLPAEGVDLAAAAQSVGGPTRETCGGCHFKGGGGDAVKHGDLDTSLLNPPERVDVHMGKLGLICVDCHWTQKHEMKGRSISVSVDDRNQVSCSDCHLPKPHEDERINLHADAVACQTCHIPEVALRERTKVHWDWSKAGEDRENADPHEYLKIKGEFVMQANLEPEYTWFDGTASRYLMGDPIAESGPTVLNQPHGDIQDPSSKIWPFKIHRGKQIYDEVYKTLLVPQTVGEGGYWDEFDWDQALRMGSAKTGLAYSGDYGFTETEMYWPLTHMVAPKEAALQCTQCHSENGILDWKALGYEGDPIDWGGRKVRQSAAAVEGR